MYIYILYTIYYILYTIYTISVAETSFDKVVDHWFNDSMSLVIDECPYGWRRADKF